MAYLVLFLSQLTKKASMIMHLTKGLTSSIHENNRYRRIHVCEVGGEKDGQWSIVHVECKAQLSEAHLVALCEWNVRGLESYVLQSFEQWQQFVFGGCSHHLWHALLAVSREDGCQLLEMFHFRIADRLYVYPPFGRCALPHVLGGL